MSGLSLSRDGRLAFDGAGSVISRQLFVRDRCTIAPSSADCAVVGLRVDHPDPFAGWLMARFEVNALGTRRHN